MTMNIRGVGWGSWSVSVLLHKVSARRIISQYINTLVLSFIALFYSLIFNHWQGLKPIALLRTIKRHYYIVRLKRKRQGGSHCGGMGGGDSRKAAKGKPKRRGDKMPLSQHNVVLLDGVGIAAGYPTRQHIIYILNY